jgi:hypothetical protein
VPFLKKKILESFQQQLGMGCAESKDPDSVPNKVIDREQRTAQVAERSVNKILLLGEPQMLQSNNKKRIAFFALFIVEIFFLGWEASLG